MPALETFEAYAPIYWAPYFINGDSSGMEDGAIRAADEWYALTFPGASIVDCGEMEFRFFGGLLTECCLYTAIR